MLILHVHVCCVFQREERRAHIDKIRADGESFKKMKQELQWQQQKQQQQQQQQVMYHVPLLLAADLLLTVC